MFYSQFILAKKGPLGTIWIAAHLERKLRKNQVADTDIGDSVDSILFPDVPIALRLSSHLLLGVVRIYSRKVNYLFDDCSEALLKVKQAFRSTAVDLPPEESTAPYHSITLPETFDLDDFELPDNDMLHGNYVDHHVSTREQITLQDTMDGVVYSTSQFGLDERFGDGDTSQIGLDLDEDLFLEKVAAPGRDEISIADPQALVQILTPLEKDGNRDQNEGLVSNTNSLEYSVAPSTPGLVEEPNFSVIPETTFDDHLESEDHNLLDKAAIENIERADHGTKNVVDDNSNNDYHGASEIKQLQPQGGSPSTPPSAVSADNHSVLVEQVAPVTLSSECSDRTIAVSNGPDTVQDMQINIADPISHSMNTNDAGCLESVGEDQLENNQTSLQQETCGDVDIVEASCAPQACEDLEDSKTVDHLVHKQLASVGEHVLQACSSHLSQPHVSSLQGELSHADGALLKPLAGESQALSEDIHGDFERLDKQPDNSIVSDNPVEYITSPANSDLPAPEKLLSAPNGLIDKPTDFLVESTPDKDIIASDGEDAGMKQISGKKRSFTESTLTVQSFNSVESFGVTQSKKTAETIPDDDDLLSSILVGRRPINLKMKPTPPVPETLPMKRLRSAPRSSSFKRKVLMDDPMVLHGDTIRQQLTSTEDVRRVRKKAPCTWIEISMIERELLEEEILSQPILTSASEKLICLHSEKYDLKGVRVTGESNSSPDLVRDVECSDKPDATGEIGIQDISDAVTDRNGYTENQQAEEHSLGLCEIDTPMQKNLIDPMTLRHENDGERTAMEVDGSCVAVADADTDVAVRLGSDSSSQIDLATADISDRPAQLAAMDANVDEDAHLQKDALCMSPLNKTESHTIHVDVRDGKGIGPTNIAESDADNHVFVETDSRPQDEFLLEERKDDAWTETGAGFQDGCFAPNDEGNTLPATMSPITDGCKNLDFVNGDHGEEQIGEEKVCVVNEDENLIADIKCDDENLTSNHIFNKEPKSGLPEEPDMDMQNAYVNVEENPFYREASQPSTMYDEITGYYPSVEDHGDFGNAVTHNTEFLNVDDDEIAEEEDDLDPHAEDTRILENTGWSSRTRAVAKYLQTLFDKEAVQGRKVIPMNNLLSGKTRKEASRMFFETLVLKTKDYIHVEQATPFDNVNIKPNIKLMKSDF